MEIQVNGRHETLQQSLTVAELLAHYKLEPLRVAVEINQQLVRRGRFVETKVADGDQIEIVTLVGGG